ncbi:GNAT family N-acetyltransferase [Flexivirga sp. ID2601S]|uniref:GNAT family N-acetyltransferase n=1 Tax=Flexivirga aerilata TaxID=1656889 RepID=A0A849AKL7_9MICO|nr:GNAT family N-acetyltransferase [Flexivirga aerilata]NNG40955.1 GNAT family N-acetyltransferase [Flexivirga aerilata]
MAITLETATVDTLEETVDALASWQREGNPVQIHPGDLGWNLSLGAAQILDGLRLWRRAGQLVAIGMDDQDVIRMGLAPDVDDDPEVAEQLVADLSDPASGVLAATGGAVEARFGTALRELLTERGWHADEPWTPLSRKLSAPVEDHGLHLRTLDAGHAPEDLVRARVEVHRASFPNAGLTVERWHQMATAPPYRNARCLIGYDEGGVAVAATTVWSAGEGRPGLIEPLGAHRDHRGHGYGRAIVLAAAATLQEMGASSVLVCTPSKNTGGVAAYVSAGFVQQPDVPDFRRPS